MGQVAIGLCEVADQTLRLVLALEAVASVAS
jgi:hypothetical protein